MSRLDSVGSQDLILAAIASAVLLYILRRLAQPTRLPLPPGPRHFPLIGHLMSLPRGSDHKVYAQIGKDVESDIIALSVFGQTIVVLNSAKATNDLLDKKSTIYSGRAQITALTDKNLLDWSEGVTFMNNNERWRRDRRMLHESLHKGVVSQYYEGQTRQIQALVGRILDKPLTFETFFEEVYFAFNSSMMHAVYGYNPSSKDDEWLKGILNGTDHAAQAAQPTTFMVNFIPALKYVPQWVPGTGWKRVLNEWREHKEWITAAPYLWTKEKILSGDASPSIVQKILAQFTHEKISAEDDLHIKLLASTLIAGGSDTTSASTMMFLLAMVQYPEVATKIQAELDSVLGYAQRLPKIDDREDMPYVKNAALELLRWQPITPLAIPHAAMEDDTYRGYRIPKGAVVMGNTWAITRDESIYPDPERFDPDRFLDPSVPSAPAFGYGRRHVNLTLIRYTG
ncbi:cytochrome P450 family protein [Ceratobasidium sp. AG-Ba]|nr:cytochrome P450 family protein [Ceratobasidium sp. AG-Ba]